MTAHPNSPNGCWQRHGFTVERLARIDGGPLTRRVIRDPSGAVVLDGVGIDYETEYQQARGMLLPEGDA